MVLGLQNVLDVINAIIDDLDQKSFSENAIFWFYNLQRCLCFVDFSHFSTKQRDFQSPSLLFACCVSLYHVFDQQLFNCIRFGYCLLSSVFGLRFMDSLTVPSKQNRLLQLNSFRFEFASFRQQIFSVYLSCRKDVWRMFWCWYG